MIYELRITLPNGKNNADFLFRHIINPVYFASVSIHWSGKKPYNHIIDRKRFCNKYRRGEKYMKKENETFYDRKNFIAIVVASAAAVLIKQYILGCMMLEDTFWNGFFIHMLVFIPIYILLLTVLRRFKKK